MPEPRIVGGVRHLLPGAAKAAVDHIAVIFEKKLPIVNALVNDAYPFMAT